jgi:hypothetical protein
MSQAKGSSGLTPYLRQNSRVNSTYVPMASRCQGGGHSELIAVYNALPGEISGWGGGPRSYGSQP